MMCTCPKCAAETELNTASIPEEGSYTPCSECKSRFWAGKESFARRALKKEGKMYCDGCGKELGSLVVCTGCGVIYPDYYLVQTNKPARRQLEKGDFSWGFGAKKSATQTWTFKPSKTAYEMPHKSTSVTPLSKKFLVRAVCLVVLVAVAAIGSYVYIQKKAEAAYAANYVRALYGLKTATDDCLQTCAAISADWKAKTDAGQRFVPRLKADDETQLNAMKDQIDKIRQKLAKPPEKFRPADTALAKLYGVYTKLNGLTITPPNSLPDFVGTTDKYQSEFRSAAQELKAGLPPELSEELEKARVKYKGMKDF